MRPGDLIGERFLIEHLAGVGGMGEVYRASDRVTGEAVAIKVLRELNLEGSERLAQESRVLETLSHPHIVKYVAHGIAPGGAPYLAMEWLDGESLATRLTRTGLRLEEAVALATYVAEALAVAHARGVVHRDVKPSNLFLQDGDIERVKVLDFGVAREHGAGRRLTLTGSIVGTPGYMAPEQARANKRAVDARADVFSLGAVLFECLTGRPAFEGDHAIAVLASLLLSDAPRVRSIRPDVPEVLDDLVARMLAKDPDERPADGSAVATELLAIGRIEGGATPMHAARSEVITDSERKLLSIVAALPPTNAAPNEAILSRERIAAIQEEIAPLGARVEEIEGGALLIGLVGRGNATDQAAHAARCALRLRALAPETRIVLVTARDEDAGRLAMGSISKRAADLLELGEEAGAVRIDASTQALLDIRFDVSVGPGGIFLRGEHEVGSGTRTLLGKPSPYLGRERELRSVRDFLEEGIDEGKPRVALVIGAPGMGKSRLRHELVEQLKRGAVEPAIAIGRGDPIGAGSAFSILGSAIRAMAGIGVNEPIASRKAKLDALISAHLSGDDLVRVRAFIGEMIGVHTNDDRPDVHAARQNATMMAESIRDAWLDFVDAHTENIPIVCVLEDLNWGDRASIKLIDAVLAAPGERRFVVLALARPEVHELFPKLWADRELLEVRLGELGRKPAERLVRHFLGDTASDAEIMDIVDRAAGNAFYLEELIRAVAEGRETLPDTVLGMVEARLVALEPEARRVLRAASVFGQTFWWGGVAALIGDAALPTGRVGLLDRLVERELIVRRRESRFAREEEYSFRHALVREGSYAMLTDRDRVRGHALAAEWLVSVGEPDAAILADHFERAGNSTRATEYFVKAAELALAAGDFTAALGFTDRARTAGAATEGEVAAELLAIRADAWHWNHDATRSYDAGKQAIAIARPGSKSYGRAIGAAVSSALLLRRRDALDMLLAELYRVVPEEDAIPVLSFAYSSAIISLLIMGKRDVAERFLQRMRDMVTPSLARDASVAGRFDYARAYWHRVAERDPFAALALDREAAAHFTVSGDRRFLPLLWAHIGFDLVLLGAHAEAEHELARAMRSATASSLPAVLAGCHQVALHVERGALDEAVSLGKTVCEQAKSQGDSILVINAQYFVLQAHLRRRDFAAAEALLDEVGPAMTDVPASAIWVPTGRAVIELGKGNAERAVELTNTALAHGARFGMKHFIAESWLMLTRAEALHAAGRKVEARDTLSRAREDLLERAARIRDSAYARSFIENVFVHARTLALWDAWANESS
ncbi:MAG: protein kinase [Polyangiaceae bacterium]|nr:protein kinase [Polyangiaceae bacterium]